MQNIGIKFTEGCCVNHYRKKADLRPILLIVAWTLFLILAMVIAGCGTETGGFPSLQPQYMAGKYFIITDPDRDGWVSYSDPNGGDDIFASVYHDTIPEGEHVWGKLPEFGKIEIKWTCGGACQVWCGRDMLFSEPDGEILWTAPEVTE